MKIQQSGEGVFQVEGPRVQVDRGAIEQLLSEAPLAPRKRVRISAHLDVAAKVHEMLIALSSQSYVRPHKHIDKSESYHVIHGEADLVLFDEQGEIIDRIRMGDFRSGKAFYARLEEPTFHSIIVWTDIVVFQETTNGPFDRDQTVGAPWAPPEDDLPASTEFHAELRRKLAD